MLRKFVCIYIMTNSKEVSYEKEVKKQRTIEDTLRKEALGLKKEFTQRTLKLVTSGFSLVAALAWNEVIKESVNIYIKPFFGEQSGVISLLIYAIAVTALVVIISYQLSKFGSEEKEG
jgi:hypothetical protein